MIDVTVKTQTNTNGERQLRKKFEFVDLPSKSETANMERQLRRKIHEYSTKAQAGGGVERKIKKSKALNKRKHDAINLPKNLVDSDGEDNEENVPSDDDNQSNPSKVSGNRRNSELYCTLQKSPLNGRRIVVEEAYQKLVSVFGDKHNVPSCSSGITASYQWENIPTGGEYKSIPSKGTGNGRQNDLCSTLKNLSLSGRKHVKEEAYRQFVKEEAYRKLTSVLRDKPLKPRSPFRNKLEEHKINKPYNVNRQQEELHSDLMVTTPHGSGGRVFVNNVKYFNIPKQSEEVSVLTGASEEHLLNAVAALEDSEFMASFKSLSEGELNQVFDRFLGVQESQTQNLLSPTMSPGSTDLYDSSYETGSPCSTVVTGLESFSPSRTSVSYSSESDQELEPWSTPTKMTPQEDHYLYKYRECTQTQPLVPTTLSTPRKIVPNRLLVEAPSFPQVISPLKLEEHREHLALTASAGTPPRKITPVRPLGEVVAFPQSSATVRLEELHNSTNFCHQHFSIQLVRVVMAAKGQTASDQVEGFCKSLLSTMKIKLGKRAHEEDIWQMSILAHIQYLVVRAPMYGQALQRRDERGHSVLYIAAVEQYKKPVVAGYIAETMVKVGFNPLEEVDERGNTIIHTVAELGDTHVHVLSELLLACGAESCTRVNNVLQTPLHVAVLSPNPHLSTVVLLLKMGANPFTLDLYQMTCFHYHVKKIARGEPNQLENMEVVRKMLQAPLSLDKEFLQSLKLLDSDPSISADLKRIILEEVNKYCIKDMRTKKNERH